jgi:hypothetical protein
VRQVEHPAVVGLASAETEAVAADDDANGIGGNQREDRIERPGGRGSGEGETSASCGQSWNAACDSGVHLLQHGGWRSPPREDATKEIVEVLAKALNAREVLIGKSQAHIEPDPREPVPQTLHRAQSLDRLSESTRNGRDQVQREAPGVETKISDVA